MVVVAREELGDTTKKIGDNRRIAKPVKAREFINPIKEVIKKINLSNRSSVVWVQEGVNDMPCVFIAFYYKQMRFINIKRKK